MPRVKRLQFENAHYHVFNRGHSKQPIFLSEYHYQYFKSILGDAVQLFKIEIYTYALMKNHFHLQICTPHGNLSKCMEYVGKRYAQFFNKDVGRRGPLWESRFKSILVDTEAYLLQLHKYIHLNPLKAGYSDGKALYKWSSLESYLEDKNDFLITKDKIKIHFDTIEQYENFIYTNVHSEFDKVFLKGRIPSIIGTEKFINQYQEVII